MSRMQCPANHDPIVRSEHFIDIEAGILKCAAKVLVVAFGALDASARGLVAVIDVVVGNDFIQDRFLLLVVSIVKTLNHVEIRF